MLLVNKKYLSLDVSLIWTTHCTLTLTMRTAAVDKEAFLRMIAKPSLFELTWCWELHTSVAPSRTIRKALLGNGTGARSDSVQH